MSHIDDGSLELYALDRVPSFEAAAIEEHLLVCRWCQDRLQTAADFAETMREATRELATELIATHRTEDGLIHLFVRPAGARDEWVGTIRGETVGGGVRGASRTDVIELCTASFRQMFPEHQCGRACITSAS